MYHCPKKGAPPPPASSRPPARSRCCARLRSTPAATLRGLRPSARPLTRWPPRQRPRLPRWAWGSAARVDQEAEGQGWQEVGAAGYPMPRCSPAYWQSQTAGPTPVLCVPFIAVAHPGSEGLGPCSAHACALLLLVGVGQHRLCCSKACTVSHTGCTVAAMQSHTACTSHPTHAGGQRAGHWVCQAAKLMEL